MNRPSDLAAIADVLGIYFDGLYYADSARLADVFHPEARYVNTVVGDYKNLSVADYLDIIDQRIAPATHKENRTDEIVSIEFGGPAMAFSKVKMSMMGRNYSDFLTFIKTENNWQIIAKVFDYRLQNKESDNALRQHQNNP